MATKKQPKNAVIEPVEEIIETDEKLAEIEEITAETVVEKEEIPEKDESKDFINRKLKAINTWTNKAKQRRAIASLFKTKGRN